MVCFTLLLLAGYVLFLEIAIFEVPTQIYEQTSIWKILQEHELGTFMGTRYVHPESTSATNITHIAIGLAFKTPTYDQNKCKCNLESFVKDLYIFKSFLPSFCGSISPYHAYHLYITYDFNDVCLSEKNCSVWFQEEFEKVINECKTKANQSDFDMIMWSLNYTGKPAWAQNDALMVAYLEGKCTYYYRVNDDTLFTTKGWTEQMITALRSMSPTNVGVTGPKHKGGNTAILTYDFVHTSHIDVFGYYYPHIFGGWFSDDWITNVYEKHNIKILKKVGLIHKVGLQRYVAEAHQRKIVKEVVENTKVALNTYINYIQHLNRSSTVVRLLSDNIIVYCLSNINITNLAGLARNAHLIKLYLPNWSMRIYLQIDEVLDTHAGYSSPNGMMGLYISHLINMRAQIYTSKTKYDQLQLNRVCLEHVFDDPNVLNFALKSPYNRLSTTEAETFALLSKSEYPLLCLTKQARTPSEDCVLVVSKQRTTSDLRNLIKEQIQPDENLRVCLSLNDKDKYTNNVVIKNIKTKFDQYEQTGTHLGI